MAHPPPEYQRDLKVPAAGYSDMPIPVTYENAPIPLHIDPGLQLATTTSNKFVVSDNPDKETWSTNALSAVPRLHAEAFPPSPAAPTEPPARRTICGFRRRTFLIVLAIIAVLLVGIAGLVSGLVVSRNNSNGVNNNEPIPAPAPTPSSPNDHAQPSAGPPKMLNNTQLAVARWSEPAHGAMSFVAYQDPVGSLMLGVWTQNDKAWKSVNVSERLLEASNPIQPKLGTPLACATNDGYYIAIFFLDTSNVVRAVYTKSDDTYRYWRPTHLYSDARLLAAPDTQLSAYWLDCTPACRGNPDGGDQIRLFFESASDDMLHAYVGAPWKEAPSFSQSGRAASALAAVPFMYNGNGLGMRLFFDVGDKLAMKSWGNSTGWHYADAFKGSTHPTFPSQQIAASSFAVSPSDVNNNQPVLSWALIALQLEQDGQLAATYWDPRVPSKGAVDKWTFGSRVELVGGPEPAPRFQRIAMNIDRKFYGIADNVILEYQVDQADLTRFVYVGEVKF
ncbi:uncharacterized protein C8A04DRAFT_30835 [Dichotomopilus funicola]|uniref:Fucose-specific lectin n=1 Tax=Dichotomopilus funicola TaxID=1934379 RepID=A0AAN6ZKA5_9PEZI|nr:hypothetical protein C8A04DRAFT_30835 [Dichotomopilus funicola]